MNVLIVNDVAWDNFAEISRRLTARNIDPQHRINCFYGKHMKHISSICNKNMLQLFRKCINKDNVYDELCKTLKHTKFCIIFHNFTEYNTLCDVIIKLCKENNIPYFIFSEHTEDFLFNGEPTNEKFRKCVSSINTIECTEIKNDSIKSFEISFEKETKNSKDYNQVLQKLKNSYKTLGDAKIARQIIILDKKETSASKQMNYIEYMTNKKKWLKDVLPKT